MFRVPYNSEWTVPCTNSEVPPSSLLQHLGCEVGRWLYPLQRKLRPLGELVGLPGTGWAGDWPQTHLNKGPATACAKPRESCISPLTCYLHQANRDSPPFPLPTLPRSNKGPATCVRLPSSRTHSFLISFLFFSASASALSMSLPADTSFSSCWALSIMDSTCV